MLHSDKCLQMEQKHRKISKNDGSNLPTLFDVIPLWNKLVSWDYLKLMKPHLVPETPNEQKYAEVSPNTQTTRNVMYCSIANLQPACHQNKTTSCNSSSCRFEELSSCHNKTWWLEVGPPMKNPWLDEHPAFGYMKVYHRITQLFKKFWVNISWKL